MSRDTFERELDTFENSDIRELAEMMIDNIPEYFFTVPASSTGKYHPSYALGDGGLYRHTCALLRLMNHMFTIEQTQNQFTSRERDLLRLSGIMHDTRKSGEADNKSKYTVFNHPLLASDAIRKFKGAVETVSDEEIEIMSKACESHMGEFNTDRKSGATLPKPHNKYEKLLHLCDYLASRKDIDVSFEEYVKPVVVIPNIEEYVISFGKKHNGEKILDVLKTDKSYLDWCKENIYKEPLQSILKEIL